MKYYKNKVRGTIDTQENWLKKFQDNDGEIDLNQVPSLVEVEQNSDQEWIEVVENAQSQKLDNDIDLPLNELGQYLESRKPLIEKNTIHSAIELGDMDAKFFHNKPELDYLFDLDRPDSIDVPQYFAAYTVSSNNTLATLKEDNLSDQIVNNYQISNDDRDFDTYNDYRNILIRERDFETIGTIDAEFFFHNPEGSVSSLSLGKEDVNSYNQSYSNRMSFLNEVKDNDNNNNFQLPKRSRKTKSTDIEDDLNL